MRVGHLSHLRVGSKSWKSPWPWIQFFWLPGALTPRSLLLVQPPPAPRRAVVLRSYSLAPLKDGMSGKGPSKSPHSATRVTHPPGISTHPRSTSYQSFSL